MTERTASPWSVALGAAVLAIGCGGAHVSSVPPPPPAPTSSGPAPGSSSAASSPAPSESDAGVPVFSGNPSWGSRTALVTIVEFADFQCPFCARSEPELARLKEVYGPGVVRFVWKNLPLSFHAHAKPAAEAAMGVFALEGADAFWKFHDSAFQSQALREGSFEPWAAAAGVRDLAGWRAGLEGHTWLKAIDADVADAKALGVDGTPTFFVNGIEVVGQQTFEEWRAIVDEQVKVAKERLAAGTRPERLYAELSRENRAAGRPPKDEPPEDPPEDTKTVYRIPLGRSPQRGSPKALVTIVEFADYECPFCVRVQATLASLRAKYGDDLRVVFKNDPLDFHEHAEAAAEAALEVRAQKGDAAYWSMHDALFASQALDEASIVKIATGLGAKGDGVRTAMARHTHAKEIDADLELAEDFLVAGTPSFFINGRHLGGAQPQEKFEAVIDEELKAARALVAAGTKPEAVYAAAIAHGKEGGALEQKPLPSFPKGDPARGAPEAKVTVHEWADFQCPFCAAVEPTLQRLLAEYPGKLRVVWHDLPLPMHADAPGAAQAAREALKQKGDAGFWALHDTLFKHQEALARADLDAYASSLGLDTTAWRAGLDGQVHKAEIEADEASARSAGLTGTPSFLIAARGSSSGYSISGAQPWVKFRRAVERALGEAR